MKKRIQFVVYANFLISFAAGLLSSGVAYSLKINDPVSYFGLVFGATLFVYNAQRLFRLPQLAGTLSTRHQWIINHKKTVVLISFIGIAISLYWFIKDFLSINSFLFLSIFGVISLLYSVKIKNFFPPLREVPFLKIHWVALTWTASCSLFPLLHLTNETSAPIIISLTLAIYTYFIAITIPFDIRDLAYDLPHQKTIPQIVGIRISVILSVTLLLSSLLFLAFSSVELLKNPFFYLAYLYQLFLLVYSYRKQKELYYSAGIDGGIILLGLCFFSIEF